MFTNMFDNITESPLSNEYVQAQKQSTCTVLASVAAVIVSVHSKGRRFQSIEFSVDDGEATIKLLDFYKKMTPNIGTANLFLEGKEREKK